MKKQIYVDLSKFIGIFGIIILLIIVGKSISASYAISTKLPDTLTSGQSDPTNRVNLYPELDGDEILAYQSLLAFDDGENSYVVYCLEKEKQWGVDVPITKGEPLDAGYVYIIQNGYNGKINPSLTTGNARYDEYLTKIAIWCYQDRSAGIDDNTDGVLTANQKNVIKNGNSKYYNIINTLVEGAISAKETDIVEPIFDLEDGDYNEGVCNNTYFIYDKENNVFKSGLYHIESNISFDGYQVIIDNNSNVKVYLEDGTLVNSTDVIDGSKKFYLQIDDDYASSIESVSFSVNVNYTKYNVYKYTPLNEQMQSGVVAVPEAVTMNKVVEESLQIPTRNLKINKKDSEGILLSNAHLIVYNYNTLEKVADFTTDGSEYVLKDLVPGTYVIDEVEAPLGYYPLIPEELKDLKLPNGTPFNNPVAMVEIGDLSEVENIFRQVSGCIENVDNVDLTDAMLALQNLQNNNKVDVENYLYEVKIRKIDGDTGKTVSGAVLNIINSNNEIVDTITTTNDYVSVDTTKLNEGTYKVVEVTAPDGYLVSTEEKTFTLDKNHTSISVDFENEKNEVLIEKRDSSDNSFVEGAVLRLVRVPDNSIIDEWTSNNKAHSIKGLGPGEYKVIEVKAPNGYTLSNSEVPVRITGDETETITVIFYNSDNQVVINKTDENGNPLSGAKLRVINSNGDDIETFTTTDEAYTLDKLGPGTYYVEEVEAPSGYTLNKERKSFIIDENTTSIQVTMENEKSFIYIGKVDSITNQYVAGAELKLTSKDENYSKNFTSSNEPLKVEVPYGEYILEEVNAPEGYIKTKEKVEIDYNVNSDENLVYTISNVKGSLTLEKIDSETGESVSGAKLEIRKGDEVVKTITTSNSPSVITDLGEGTYEVVEVNTPSGYIKSDKKYTITIDSKNPNGKVVIENEPIIVNLGKIDARTGEYISGAIMRLSRLDGEMEPITFVSSNSPYKVMRLSPGLYSFEEIEAPSGYIGTGSKVTFRVLETGKIQSVNVSNDITTISINNRILNVDTKGISGYSYRLETRDGNLIDEFEVTKEGYISEELELGDYTLKQIEAPSGVIVNEEPIYFSVSDNNEVSVINFVNDFTKINISKKDMAGSEEVEGAHLVIRDSSGQVVEEWVSSDSPYYIEKLPVGRYTITETIAPDGYVLNTAVVEFNVLETGDIQSEVMYNSRLVEVPNTNSNATYIYLIGGILIIIGGVLIYISYKNKTRIKSSKSY